MGGACSSHIHCIGHHHHPLCTQSSVLMPLYGSHTIMLFSLFVRGYGGVIFNGGGGGGGGGSTVYLSIR